MFSVNNFYNILESNYRYPKTNNYVITFKPHGSKDWDDLLYWAEHDVPLNVVRTQGHLICHDQEPCFVDMLDTYRNDLILRKKDLKSVSHLSPSELDELVDIVRDISNFDFFHLIWKATRMPILCHSELNSKDILEFEENNFISCYYWWHGMIARDWFRHWEHHGELKIYDKSRSPRRFLLYARATDGTRAYRTKVIDFFKTNFNWEGNDVSSHESANISVTDANKYAIHVVAETLYNTTKLHLTEKVFKPMVMSQPFILFAPPGSLQYLRAYGFKTFESCWDESYDTIIDSELRMQEIFRLLNKLNSYTHDEFQTLYIKLLPIIEHNRKHFYSSNFQSHLINEMNINMHQAIQKQSEHYLRAPGDPWFRYLDNIAKKRKLPSHWVKWLRELLAADDNLIKTINNYPRLRSLI